MPPSAPEVVPAAVSARLNAFLTRMREEASAEGDDAIRFAAAAERSIQGGKRLRARFCHAGFRAATEPGASEPEALWGVCAALELFQAAALVHDDLIDNSDTRRGRPAAHRAFEADHLAAGWAGDPAAFGRSSAILLGDLLVAWSDDLFEEAIALHSRASSVRGAYARMRRDVTIGQFLDVAEESAWSVSPASAHAERALRVVSLKSARYSIEQPIALGALLAGANAKTMDALREFGHPLGMAFQLRDDVLGVFGDAAVTGKPAGDDLREGKRTVLIAYTGEALDAAERTELDAALGDPDLSAKRIAELQDLIRRSGALERVEDLISTYVSAADRAISEATLNPRAVNELRILATAATTRVA